MNGAVGIRWSLRAAGAALGGLAVVLAAGCGDEPLPRSIRLTLRADVRVPQDADRVVLEAIAGRLPGDRTCAPHTRELPLTGAGAFELPVVVDFLPGETYAAWLGLRITWFRGVDAVAVQVSRPNWPADGVLALDVVLRESCLSPGCSPRQCVDGTCVDLPSFDPFDAAYRDASAPDCVLVGD